MKNTDILQVITEWQNHILRIKGIKRDYESVLLSTMGSKPIKIITGFRRSGKSFLTQRVAKKLVEDQKYSIDNILYLNFEDFRLTEINTPEKLNGIYQVFKSNIADNGKKLLIFDEIQNVTAWDRFIRTIYELENDIEIILTGSNSELLSSEIGSNLAGRFIEFSIFPFDFKEFLKYRDIEIASDVEFFRNYDEIQKLFADYMKFGGLPETFTISNSSARFSYIEGVVSKVILDDIIERFQVKHVAVIEKVLIYLLSGVGNIISFTRIMNYLKPLGIKIKQETLIDYVQYILKSFALYETQKFDWKLGRLFETTRKYYSVDTGLINLYQGTVNDFTSQLENIVFLKLKRSGSPVYFGALKSGKEIDFIVQQKNKKYQKFQVCQTLTNENHKRELSSFNLKDTHLEVGENFLLTLDDHEEEISFNENLVYKKNLVKWLLL